MLLCFHYPLFISSTAHHQQRYPPHSLFHNHRYDFNHIPFIFLTCHDAGRPHRSSLVPTCKISYRPWSKYWRWAAARIMVSRRIHFRYCVYNCIEIIHILCSQCKHHSTYYDFPRNGSYIYCTPLRSLQYTRLEYYFLLNSLWDYHNDDLFNSPHLCIFSNHSHRMCDEYHFLHTE